MMNSLTVGFVPWWPQNPYQILLKKELNALGIRVIGNPPFSIVRLLVNRDGLDIVHIHWPHSLYLDNPWRFPFSVLTLLLYRFLKNNIVWTVHELDFYETRTPLLDIFIRWVLMHLCRTLFVHGEHTADEIQRRYQFRRRIIRIRHPSYKGFYPDTVRAREARVKLGINAEKRVFLFIGYVKPYKGVEELIDAFLTVNDEQWLLLIAGKPLNADIKHSVEKLAAVDSRIKTDLRYIGDEEVQVFLRAADVVVFPFRQTQTSGSVMLALTFGKPVIAPLLATIPEYVDDSVGILFDPNKPGDLVRALRKIMACDLDSMGQAAAAKAASLSWAEMAQRQAQEYERIL